jgi:hypothetical protein
MEETLKPLIKLPVAIPLQNPGRPARMEWLPIAALRIDSTYQRQMLKQGEKNAERIARGFRWDRFAPVIVTPVNGRGLYALIDGQHRATAALTLGYDRVPAYIVDADPETAARIFAAVNGNVTAMTAYQVFKAARAGGEEWAIAIDRACKAAGVRPLVHATMAKLLKPFDTIAIGALRRILTIHGEDVLRESLKLVCASKNADRQGFLRYGIIVPYGQMMAGRPGWLRSHDALARAIAPVDLGLVMPEQAEALLVRAVGDGRTATDTWSAIVSRVADLKARRLSPTMIATQTRLTYAEVERALKEIG